MELGGQICDLFDDLCISVIERLREQKIFQSKFGRNIPVIFFDREGLSPEANALTLRANPPELIEEFVAFLKQEKYID